VTPSATATGGGWRPRIGAWLEGGRGEFRVWAPDRTQIDLVLHPDRASPHRYRMAAAPDGMASATVEDVRPGDLYWYGFDGEGPFPDPASRFQPQGVHGPSAVVDPGAYEWSDHGWRGLELRDAIIYELHVGAFTPDGTFAAVTERLPDLAALGVTVIELMPVADFPGSRNWGYDGVSLFAPSRVYGTPDDLRRLVDVAHGLGLAVLLDVVYNHFGPDGAYAPAFSARYLSDRHSSPWGAAVNLDGEGSRAVRDFFIENALHWLHEYHVDGFRLDATHGLIDDSAPHFVAELAARARAAVPDRTILLIAEDERNLAAIVRPQADGGWGLDAMWADDLHHHLRRLSAGDKDGYYEDYSGSTADVAETIRHGWFYRGQHSVHRGAPRGTDPAGVAPERMVMCLQNHDQVGNRPFGRRLHHQVEPAVFRALSALLLCLPQTPLLFMGQEWAASSRFRFFTDHHDELGRLVTDGRRAEFSRFEAFADPVTRMQIPDPQAWSTFADSRLEWDERTQPLHAGVLELYRALLRLRREHLAALVADPFDVTAVDGDTLVLVRGVGHADAVLLAVCLGPARRIDLAPWRTMALAGRWTVALTTEDPPFVEEGARPATPAIDVTGGPVVTFAGPSAVVLRGA
jgi:maltooligosyltrehalose trehalohydrolase